MSLATEKYGGINLAGHVSNNNVNGIFADTIIASPFIVPNQIISDFNIQLQFEVNGPGFMLNDIIRASRYDYDVNGNPINIYNVDAQVTEIVKGDVAKVKLLDGNSLSFITSDNFKYGMDFVRVGNTTDTTRQGSVYMTSIGTGAPYIDVIDGVSSVNLINDPSTLKVRLGKLSGITDPLLGTLSDYGIYTQNGYFRGTLFLGNASASGVGVGVWMDKTGIFRAGDPSLDINGNPNDMIKFDPVVGELDIYSKKIKILSTSFRLDTTVTQPIIALGTSASAMTFALGTGFYTDGSGVLRVGSYSTNSGAKNRLEYDGINLNIFDYANNNIFSIGSATSATFGNMTISNALTIGTLGNISIFNAGAGANGFVLDQAGIRGYDTVLGETFNLPTNGTAPTFSSGVIDKTIFKIYTSGVIRTSDTVGDGSSLSAGLLINNTGLYGVAANQLAANANVKILNDGSGQLAGGNISWTSAGVLTVSGYTPTGSANKTYQQTTAPASGMATGDIWLDTSNGNKPYSYNGTAWIAAYTLINGGNIITGTITASQINLATINTTSLNNNAGWTNGATWGSNLYGIPTTLGSASAAGLYLNSSYMGYYDGSTWKTYMDSSGNFGLSGSSGGSLTWTASTNALAINNGTISGSTITGGTLQTSPGGQRIVIDTSNQILFYGTSGYSGSIYGSDILIISSFRVISSSSNMFVNSYGQITWMDILTLVSIYIDGYSIKFGTNTGAGGTSTFDGYLQRMSSTILQTNYTFNALGGYQINGSPLNFSNLAGTITSAQTGLSTTTAPSVTSVAPAPVIYGSNGAVLTTPSTWLVINGYKVPAY